MDPRNPVPTKRFDRSTILRGLQLKLGFSLHLAQRTFDEQRLHRENPAVIMANIERVAAFFGRDVGRAVTRYHLGLLTRPLERIPHRKGHLNSETLDARETRFALALCPELVNVNDAEFDASITTLCRLIPAIEPRRMMLRCYPQILLIPAGDLNRKQHVRWSGDPHRFWREIVAGMENPPTLSVRANGSCGDNFITEFLIEEMMERKADAKHMRSIAVHFANAFQARALIVLRSFFHHQWSIHDIRAVCHRSDMTWHKHPNRLFEAERELVEIGIDPIEARQMVIHTKLFSQYDARYILLAVQTLRELQIEGLDLPRIAREAPNTLYHAPEFLRTWHAATIAKGQPPMDNLFPLTRTAPSTHVRT